MRSLLVAIAKLPWRTTSEHPAISTLPSCKLYISKDPESCQLKWWHQVWNDLAGFDLQPRPGTGVSGVGGGHPVCPAPRGAQWLGLD
jgi:hypothetical protein